MHTSKSVFLENSTGDKENKSSTTCSTSILTHSVRNFNPNICTLSHKHANHQTPPDQLKLNKANI